jgi:hypothetical protein
MQIAARHRGRDLGFVERAPETRLATMGDPQLFVRLVLARFGIRRRLEPGFVCPGTTNENGDGRGSQRPFGRSRRSV